MGELGQSPDDLTNQIHSVKSGQVFPVLRTDPKAYMVNDGTNDRVMIGGFGDGSYGLKVSQSGYDVKTATDTQLVMSSGFNLFKIVNSGTQAVTRTGGSAQGLITIAHGLGYTPAFIFFKAAGSVYGQGFDLDVNANGTIGNIYSMTSDGTNVYLSITAPGSAATNALFNTTATVTFKYFLLKETAT